MNIVKLSQVAPGQICFIYDAFRVISWCHRVKLLNKAPMFVIEQFRVTDLTNAPWPVARVITEHGVFEFSGAIDVTLDANLERFTYTLRYD